MKTNWFNSYKHFIKSFMSAMPRFFKYQIVTKLLFSVLIMPIFWLATQFLIQSQGTKVVTNSMLGKFIFSPQGIVFLLMASALVLIGLLLELCGFISISSQIIHGQAESSYKELVRSNLRKMPQMLEYGSLFIFLYIVILVPLSGSGMTLSFLESIKIPNFITSVIWENPLYKMIYGALLIGMLYLSVRWIFTFHFMVIANLKPSLAMKASAQLISKHFKYFLKEVFKNALFTGVILFGVIIIWASTIAFLTQAINFESGSNRIMMAFLLLFQETSIILATMLLIPFEVHHFTMLFYGLVEVDTKYKHLENVYPAISPKEKKSFIDQILSWKKSVFALVIGVLLLLSIPAGIFLNELIDVKSSVEVMGHRGGGKEGPENTLIAIKKSIDNKAKWVEIDVQRTQDGVYILNHDEGFSRVAGVDRAVTNMTYAEIKQLDVGRLKGSHFQGERVPTLEQVLDYCKGKIKINIELKGKTADYKMMESVVAMVNKRNMADQVILTSLDDEMVEQIEYKYPNMNTGYIFFAAFGKIGEVQADYLILEEAEASDEIIDEIHVAGKKAVVWTVNKPESMERFVHSDADAVITDDVKGMVTAIETEKNANSSDRLLEAFFSVREE